MSVPLCCAQIFRILYLIFLMISEREIQRFKSCDSTHLISIYFSLGLIQPHFPSYHGLAVKIFLKKETNKESTTTGGGFNLHADQCGRYVRVTAKFHL